MIYMPMVWAVCARRFEMGVPVIPTTCQTAIQHNIGACLLSSMYGIFTPFLLPADSSPASISPGFLLCPHQTIEQSPRQNEPSQPPAQPTRPQLPGSAKVPARIKQGFPRGHGLGGHADGVEEDGGQQGEDDVEKEAVVGLEAEDAGGDAEEGGCEGLEIGEGLLMSTEKRKRGREIVSVFCLITSLEG